VQFGGKGNSNKPKQDYGIRFNDCNLRSPLGSERARSAEGAAGKLVSDDWKKEAFLTLLPFPQSAGRKRRREEVTEKRVETKRKCWRKSVTKRKKRKESCKFLYWG